ncbi:hypothetical protein, partial [Ensifer aridi]|uniref:hypothetical protein n=1 Tax=Ensifer aridi TaxID=1708715 RepID=UPI001AEC7D06
HFNFAATITYRIRYLMELDGRLRRVAFSSVKHSGFPEDQTVVMGRDRSESNKQPAFWRRNGLFGDDITKYLFCRAIFHSLTQLHCRNRALCLRLTTMILKGLELQTCLLHH